MRPLGRIAVRGMTGLAEVFEPWLESVPPELRESYAEAVAAHESDPDRARELFAELSAKRFPATRSSGCGSTDCSG